MKTLKLINAKILSKISFAAVIILAVSALFVSPALAQCASENSSNCGGPSGNTTPVNSNPCDNTTSGNTVDRSKVQQCVQSTPIWHDIQIIVDFLSGAVGLVVTAVIITGGVQYAIAGDNPQALQAARQRMINGVIALFAFLFIWAFLNWLIPGGVFSQ